MHRFAAAGLLVLFVLPAASGRAGPVHYTKAEVQTARIELYEHEMTLRGENPTGFDQKFPVLGKILASEQGYDEFLSERTFSKLLCVHTPFLWRMVAGDIFYHRIHPWPEPGLVQIGGPNSPIDNPSGDGGPGHQGSGSSGDPGGSGGSGSPGGGSGGTVGVASVPEPSSAAILTGGITLVLLATIRRQIYKRLTGLPGGFLTAKLRVGRFWSRPGECHDSRIAHPSCLLRENRRGRGRR